MFSVGLVVWIVALTLLVVWLHSSMKRPKGYPPGPRKWPFVGNLPKLAASESFAKYWFELGQKYDGIASMKIGELDFVVITDYELAKRANAMEELVERPPYEFFRFYQKYKNSGILFSNGENWKTQRRYTLRCLRDFGLGKSSVEHLIIQEFKDLAENIHPTHIGNEPKIVELDSALDAAVTNLIWWLAANKKLSKGDAEFEKLLATVVSIVTFDATQLLSYFPSLYHKMPRYLMGLQRKEEMRDHFYSYIKGLMDEHRKTLDINEPRDLIDCYLREQQRLLEAGEDPDIFDDDMTAWTLADLFIAGSETTSVTLRWFFLFMIHNPGVQAKIQEEIDRVVGKDRVPSWEDRPDMPYTEATIWESLRLKPPLPVGLERRATRDFVLGGHKIPKGTIVTTVIHGIHRDPKVFKNPLEYDPTRFLDRSGNLVKDPKIMPFQAGRRQCLGEALARMTLFVGITYLLQRFTFQKVPGESYTFHPKRRTEAMTVPLKYKILMTPRTTAD